MKKIHTPINKSIGSQFKSIPKIGDTRSSSGAAVTLTPLSANFEIKLGSSGAYVVNSSPDWK